jgi:hypothetical protein
MGTAGSSVPKRIAEREAFGLAVDGDMIKSRRQRWVDDA